ncbi:MAG: hypothetical protein VCD34_05265 [Planctomycetota bacterium]
MKPGILVADNELSPAFGARHFIYGTKDPFLALARIYPEKNRMHPNRQLKQATAALALFRPDFFSTHP